MEKKSPRKSNDKPMTEKAFEKFTALIMKSIKSEVGASEGRMLNVLKSSEERLTQKIDDLRNDYTEGMDQIVGLLSDQKVENAAQFTVNQRHDTWIKEIAQQTKSKLSMDA
jgi:hypothetical protein